ncbi:hypothetical protein ACFQFH_16330 [Halobaculum halobium]
MSDIHDQIRSFIDGNVENLGEAVSGIAGGDSADADGDTADVDGSDADA